MTTIGREMYEWMEKLFPICRSITGNGFRETLFFFKEILGDSLKIYEIPSGTKVFDWVVPREWNVREAWIKDSKGNVVVNFKDNNLHLVGYSIPVHSFMTLNELESHLYSLPENPEAIPYVTSYYDERWGFCLKHSTRKELKEETYEVFIDSDLSDGSLTYGELILPGKLSKEIFLSTYLCHPSLANNELSGPVVQTAITRWIQNNENRNYTYRIIFIPESIGSITYLSKNLEKMKNNIIAGFVLSCLGDNRGFSILPSINVNTLSDQVARHVSKYFDSEFKEYSFIERGSDEKHYCSPLVDLPVCVLMRSKFGCPPHDHTSADNMNIISEKSLETSFNWVKKIIECIENESKWISTIVCEPQMGRRGLYSTISTKDSWKHGRNRMNVIAYSNGKRSLLEIAEILNLPMWDIIEEVKLLEKHHILKRVY